MQGWVWKYKLIEYNLGLLGLFWENKLFFNPEFQEKIMKVIISFYPET